MSEWDQLKQKLDINVTAWMPDETKQKIVDSTRALYNANSIYEIQMRANSFCRQIEISRTIGMNDVIVPILIHEYAELMYCMKALHVFLPMLKQTPAPINMVLDAVKVKSVSSWLYDDLQLLISKHDVKIDLTSCMTIFKAFAILETPLIVKAAKHKDFAVNGFIHCPLIQADFKKHYGN